MTRNLDICDFISSIRTSYDVEYIFLHGNCYKLYEILQILFGNCTPYLNTKKQHVITEHLGSFYDITGKVSSRSFRKMAPEQKRIAKTWRYGSFSTDAKIIPTID